MEKNDFEVGTLLDDGGKLAIIYREIETGDLDTVCNSIKWSKNYELYYLDGDIAILSEGALSRLIKYGQIIVIKDNPQNLSIDDFKKRQKSFQTWRVGRDL